MTLLNERTQNRTTTTVPVNKVQQQRPHRWRRLAPILLVTPMIALATIFVLVPAILTFIGSLFSIPFAGGEWAFVGFDNFARVFSTTQIIQSMINTVIFSAITIIPSLVLGLGMALAVDSLSRGKPLIRTLLFLPMTANMVAIAVVFKYIFDTRIGVANSFLDLLGIPPVNWLGDSTTAMITVAMVGVWRTASFTMLIFFAGLTTIPDILKEATRMDGITGWTKLTKITLPVMKPSVVFAVVMAVLQSVQAFDTIRVMTDGGPQYGTEVIQTMTWRMGFEYFDLGTASALSFIMVVVLLLVGLWQRRVLAGEKE